MSGALTRLSGDAQTFAEKVWARSVHVHRGEPDSYADLLSLDDVDELLTSSGLRTPSVRLAQDGTVLPADSYTTTARVAGVTVSGLVDPRAVLDRFSAGATVILQALHRYWPPLTVLVAELEAELGHPCQANAYLTPAGAQGFARHRDTHDVFVFQTYGEKSWEIGDDSGVRQVLMQPGLSMYLPTGTPHSARAQSGASLHVTVGINRITWRAVLERGVADLLSGPELDEPLPAGYHTDLDAFARDVDRRLADLRQRLATVDAETVATGQLARFATSRPSLLRGALRDRVNLAGLDDATQLRRRPGARVELLPAADGLRVLLGDRELRVPAHLQEPLAHVAAQRELSAASLAEWLDPQSRLVLVRRLVKEGLLEVVR